LLTVVGEGLQAGTRLVLGESPLTNIRLTEEHVLTGTVAPGKSAGPVTLAIINPDGVTRRIENAFVYGGAEPAAPAPAIIGVTPLSSPTEGSVPVSILGEHFQTGLVVFFDTTPVPVAAVDPNLLEVTAPPHATGLVAIRVINPDGKQASLPVDQSWNSFAYDSNEPSVWMVNPMQSPTRGGERVTLFGSNFRAGATIDFNGSPGLDPEITESIIWVTTPPRAAGPVEITVTNPGGLSSTYAGDIIFGQFQYYGPPLSAPVVTLLAVRQGPLTGGTRVMISGQNFYAGVRVFFGPKEAKTSLQSETLLEALTPPGELGAVDVTIRNLDGQSAVAPGAFTYVAPQPQVQSVKPSSGPSEGGTLIQLLGAGFLPDSQVLVGDQPVPQVDFLNATNLSLRTPPGFPGPAAIKVINPGSVAGELAKAFTYEGQQAPPPVLNQVTPSFGPHTGGAEITLAGAAFLPGLTVTVGEQSLLSTRLLFSGAVTGVTPPGPPGAMSIRVRNRDGQETVLPLAFTYLDPQAAPPAILSLTPETGPASGGTELTITGSGFQPGARVFLPPNALVDVRHVSPQELRATTPPLLPGVYPLRVVNPDGQHDEIAGAYRAQAEAARPRWTSIRLSDGRLRLTASDLTVAATYILEKTDTLIPAQWSTVETLIAESAEAQWSEALSPGAASFYRLRAP
jgi:hypothetical protein